MPNRQSVKMKLECSQGTFTNGCRDMFAEPAKFKTIQKNMLHRGSIKIQNATLQATRHNAKET